MRASLKVLRKKPRLKDGPAISRPVTVVILTWNAVNQTINLINSLVKHPLPSNCELLFVDNGSEDYTVDYLMAFDDIELIINPENRGYTRAANQGIASTTNDIVLL